MYCKNCGKEVDGKFCSNCGMPVNDEPGTVLYPADRMDDTPMPSRSKRVPNIKEGKKAPSGCARTIGVVLLVIGILVLAVGVMAILGDSDETASNSQSTVSEKKTEKYITLKKYNKIKSGMTYKEVVDIIGFTVKKDSENTINFGIEGEKDLVTESYTYRGKNFGSYATFVFQNGKLTIKSQSGLK